MAGTNHSTPKKRAKATKRPAPLSKDAALALTKSVLAELAGLGPEGVLNLLREGMKEIGLPGTDLRHGAIQYHNKLAAHFEALFLNTNNPIWVWRCIATLRLWCTDAASICPEFENRQFVGDIPNWCLDQIITGAINVAALSYGIDYENPAADCPDGLIPFLRPPLSAADAMARVPTALGLVRPGWNSFKGARADDAIRPFLEVNEHLAAQGKKPLTAKQIAEVKGVADERGVRREITEAKKRGTKP